MLACTIHAKEDLRIESAATPDVGPGEVLVRLGAGGICGSDLHYYLRGPQRQLRHARAADSRATRRPASSPRSAPASRASRSATRSRSARRTPAAAATTAAKGREQLCSSMRFLGSASLFPHVQGMFQRILRDGRAAVLSGRRRRVAGRARVRRAAGRRAARRQPRPAISSASRCSITGAGTIGCLTVIAARLAGRGAGHRQRRPRPAAREGARGRCRLARCAPIATPTRSPRRNSTSASRCRAASRRSSPASPPSSAAASSCRSARCRTSRCRSSSTS